MLIRVIGGKVYGTGGVGYKPFNHKNRLTVDTLSTVMSKLSAGQKELICRVLGVSNCDNKALDAFMKINPADRQFRLSNAVSAAWAEPNFLEKIQYLRIARATLESVCNLAPVSAADKCASVRRVDNLSDLQKYIVAKITSQETVTPETIDTFSNIIAGIAVEERANYWKRHVLSLVTVGDLIHKLRFEASPTFNEAEQGLICAILGKDWPAVSDRDIAAIAKDVLCKVDQNDGELNHTMKVLYSKLSSEGFVKSADTLWKVGQLVYEYHTLLGSLGLDGQYNRAYLDRKVVAACSIGQQHAAEGKSYEDASVSLIIRTHEDRAIYLDAVFDGMGGYSGGATASLIGITSITVSALSGLITSPEEARRAVILADLGIMFGAIDQKPPNYKFRIDGQEMGSTVAISFALGNEFYGIHAGDSSYNVCRNGKIIFKSIEHSMLFYIASASYPGGVDAYVAASYEEKIAFFNSDAAKIVFKQFESISHQVGSALGCCGNNNIEINNGATGPIRLQAADVAVTQSDGTETVTDEEIATIVSSKSPEDAAREIHGLAVSRVDLKADDKTVVVRRIS